MKWEVENSDTHGQEKNMKEWEVGHVEEKKGVSGRWKQGRNKLKKKSGQKNNALQDKEKSKLGC